MRRYILNRLVWMILIVLASSILIFTLLYFTPGDPAVIILGNNSTDAEYAYMRAQLGIDKPFFTQLAVFLRDIFLRLDFGESWHYHVPVMKELLQRLPRTVIIGVFAMVLTCALGIPLGVYAALHEGKAGDSITMALTMFLVAAPNFWLALMLIILFSVKLDILPSYGIEGWTSYILPIISIALANISNFTRQTRSSMLEVIRADYISTARSKGQTEGKIVLKHMLPNALMPVITVAATQFAGIVAGSSIIESVFSIPGIGLYLLDGIDLRDYPVVRACVIFLSVFTSVAMLLCDLAYGYVDPESRHNTRIKRCKL